MNVDPRHIQIGMDVFGIDGEQIGTVKAVGATEILVDRPFARDVYVPLDAIQAIVDASASDSVDPHVTLTIRADSVGDMGWRHP